MQPSFIYIIARLRAIVNKNYSVYNICIKYVAGYLIMIVYDKLWKTMQAKGISQYKLIRTYGISTGQLDRLRKNDNVITYTLNSLCKILDCSLSDIAEYVPDDKNIETDK